jgi:peptide-methionine (R)-S-oxide reductase
MSKEELAKRLSKEQFYVTQNKGTERAFTGKFWDHHDTGAYTCVVCGEKLFESKTKFESGTGWPSFYDKAGQNTSLFYLSRFFAYACLLDDVL